jgi:hypothetical protein
VQSPASPRKSTFQTVAQPERSTHSRRCANNKLTLAYLAFLLQIKFVAFQMTSGAAGIEPE